MKKYQKKISGGKLLIIKIQVDKGVISNILILGDFFLYPEDKLKELEYELVKKDKSNALFTIESVIKKHNIKIIGFAPEDLYELIKKGIDESEMEINN